MTYTPPTRPAGVTAALRFAKSTFGQTVTVRVITGDGTRNTTTLRRDYTLADIANVAARKGAERIVPEPTSGGNRTATEVEFSVNAEDLKIGSVYYPGEKMMAVIYQGVEHTVFGTDIQAGGAKLMLKTRVGKRSR